MWQWYYCCFATGFLLRIPPQLIGTLVRTPNSGTPVFSRRTPYLRTTSRPSSRIFPGQVSESPTKGLKIIRGHQTSEIIGSIQWKGRGSEILPVT
ncbi:hypothetical protein DL98DRAFT_136376 [Cadophora sp. DSE1049]|nr:hypothetical protein DL98DRAFT_136376 [Cadophora sp. DSE1049]